MIFLNFPLVRSLSKHLVSGALLSSCSSPGPSEPPGRAGLVGRSLSHLVLSLYLGISHPFILGFKFCVCHSNHRGKITNTDVAVSDQFLSLCCHSVTSTQPLWASPGQSPSLLLQGPVSSQQGSFPGVIEFKVKVHLGLLYKHQAFCLSVPLIISPLILLVSSPLVLCQGLVYF